MGWLRVRDISWDSLPAGDDMSPCLFEAATLLTNSPALIWELVRGLASAINSRRGFLSSGASGPINVFLGAFSVGRVSSWGRDSSLWVAWGCVSTKGCSTISFFAIGEGWGDTGEEGISSIVSGAKGTKGSTISFCAIAGVGLSWGILGFLSITQVSPAIPTTRVAAATAP